MCLAVVGGLPYNPILCGSTTSGDVHAATGAGGRKQRVAIIKAPKILLSDKANSALDAESERVVQDCTGSGNVEEDNCRGGLSTIKGADMIAVVKNGLLAEKGGHETLVNIKNGIYDSLVQLHSTAAS